MKYGLMVGIVYATVPIILMLLLRTKRDDRSDTFRYPKFTVYIGAVDVALTAIALYMIVVQPIINNEYPVISLPADIAVDTAAFSIHLLGWILISLHLVWRVELLDEYFTYTNLIGIKRKYKYTDITLVKAQYDGSFAEKYIIYAGKKRLFGIDYLAINFSDFERKLRTKMRKNGARWNMETNKVKKKK